MIAKKLYLKLPLLCLLFFTFFANVAKADPLDESVVSIMLPACKNQACNLPNLIPVDYMISWPEAVYLVHEKTGVSITDPAKLENYQNLFVDYIQSKTVLSSSGSPCEFDFKNMPEPDPDVDGASNYGISFDGDFACQQPINSLTLTSSLFAEYISTQKNIINIYEGGSENLATQTVLTVQNQTTILDLQKLVSPGASISLPNAATNQSSSHDPITYLFNKLKDNNHVPWPVILLIVFLLGLLHSLETGHSKTVLAALLVNKEISLRRSFGYAAVFTLTHVADILILGILFISANLFFNIFSLLPDLQLFSFYALLLIAIYLLIKNTSHYLKHRFEKEHHHHHWHSHQHEHGHSHEAAQGNFKHQLYIGFMTGLAPCLFGWSVFMLFLSTGHTWFIIPLILVFALGIFLSLVIIATIIVKFKGKFFTRYQWFTDLSPIISALILLAFAIWQLV